MGTDHFHRFFTPPEAAKRLPLVKKIVEDILKNGQRLQTLITADHRQSSSTERARLQDEIEELIEELEKLGCFYKDWNFQVGLIDFPSIIEGKEVFLCWRSDEPKLLWYHGIEEGYLGRKLIPENFLQITSSKSDSML